MHKNMNHQRSLMLVGAICLASAIAVPAAQAQRLTCNRDTITASPGCTPVFFFQGGADGGDPVGGVTLGANGDLYGTTTGGGTNNGTVYQLASPAKAGSPWGYTLLYSFGTIGGSDGLQPQGPLVIDANGVLYGMTPYGGSAGCGVVFSLTPPAIAGGSWPYSVIYNFLGGSDGCNPWYSGLVIGKNGVFYGTTAYGGSTENAGAGWGTVFQLTVPAAPGGAWTESVLYSFTGGIDGGAPEASLLSTSGVLYGTAYTGGIHACPGGNGGCGVVFELKPRSGGKWKQSVLYSFAGGNDGGNSSAPVIIKNGALYGTTSQENNVTAQCSWGCGTVFELAPPAVAGGVWTETALYHFVPNPAYPGPCPTEQCDASTPVGGVIFFGAGGALYGTTSYGGAFSTGTIFELAPPATAGGSWTETVLYDTAFDATTGGYTNFPQSPLAGLIAGKKGIVYGTTTGDAGMVFQLKL